MVTTLNATRSHAQHSGTEPATVLFNMDFGGFHAVILVLEAGCAFDWLAT